MNLDFHFKEKAALIGRAWDHVIVQGLQHLDADKPAMAAKIVDYSARLAQPVPAPRIRGSTCVGCDLVTGRPDLSASRALVRKPIETMAIDVRAAYDRRPGHSSYIRAVIRGPGLEPGHRRRHRGA